MPHVGFSRAAVIGTGMMGPGIAVSLTLAGLPATLLSRTAEGAARGLAKAQNQLFILNENGLASDAATRWARENLTASDGFEATVGEADLVIESAPENLAFKQDLFRQLDAIASAQTVLASNTSGLSITAIAGVCRRPERVLTTHFWNPPHLMRLVELVRAEQTSDTVAEAVKALLQRAGKAVVLVRKDRPGQLGNRLQIALQREALHIVREGIASVEDVDLAVKAGFGLRLPVYGVFEHMDAVGLDMVLGIIDYISQDLYTERRAPEAIRENVAAGRFGAKSGQGFYDWRVRDIEAVEARRDGFLLEFLRSQSGSPEGDGPRTDS
jgi:3-hydroxybutyryl-CoA dehydrogenase